jgi:triosephosphate isomerase
MKNYLFGNWKMNMNGAEIDRFFHDLASSFPEKSETVMAIFPPFVYLERTVRLAKSMGVADKLSIGVQNVHEADKGAYTGEISVEMALDCGAEYSLIGHSERRHVFGESEERIAAKVNACCSRGLRTVLCVGETLEERDRGVTWETVERQLKSGLSGDKIQSDSILVAYEPVWAIGTGRSASPEDAQEVCGAIRKWLSGRFAGATVPILYGGSVKPDNSESLFSMTDIDGGLVGGASLDPGSFLYMVR